MRNKIICLEDEQFKYLLEQDNASNLIRSLLQKHMNEHKYEGMTMEQLNREEAILLAQRRVEELQNAPA